ncbi:hypothetical protein FOZ62_022588, partial [Perkinsus olseni]
AAEVVELVRRNPLRVAHGRRCMLPPTCSQPSCHYYRSEDPQTHLGDQVVPAWSSGPSTGQLLAASFTKLRIREFRIPSRWLPLPDNRCWNANLVDEREGRAPMVAAQNGIAGGSNGGTHGSQWRHSWVPMEALMGPNGGTHGSQWRHSWVPMEALT